MRSWKQITTAATARLTEESGIALPLVLAVLIIGLSLGSAAVIASVGVQSGSIRDEDSKAAIAAADAAVLEAVHRQNRVPTTTGNRCLVVGAGATLVPGPPAADGWCPAVSGSVGTASWTYRVRHWPVANGVETLEVVGTGTSDSVSRRIEVSAQSQTGANPFGNNAVVGDDFIQLDSDATVEGNAATNGDITLNSNASLCGTAQVGTEPGDSLNLIGNSSHGGPGCTQATYPVTAAETSLIPVFQGDVPTQNSNSRFFGQDLPGGKVDEVTWNSSTRTLIVGNNSWLTLGGINYSLCRLELAGNSTLYIAAGANVRIYFDAPENCPGSPSTQLLMNSNTRIVSSSGNPAQAALLFVGSDTLPTSALLNSNSGAGGSNCENSFVLYGPRTDITLNSDSTWCGALAGKSIHLDSNAHVKAHTGVGGFTLPVPLLYRGARYVECVGAATTAPDQGC